MAIADSDEWMSDWKKKRETFFLSINQRNIIYLRDSNATCFVCGLAVWRVWVSSLKTLCCYWCRFNGNKFTFLRLGRKQKMKRNGSDSMRAHQPRRRRESEQLDQGKYMFCFVGNYYIVQSYFITSYVFHRTNLYSFQAVPIVSEPLDSPALNHSIWHSIVNSDETWKRRKAFKF